MRTGKNPAKAGMPAYQSQELGVAIITYIPFLDGYFAQSLHILKYQIASLRATVHQPFDLLIFDNGSCQEVVSVLEELQRQQTIDFLILSRHNVGKAGAWNWIFSSMPNSWICYADSDVLFRHGWLEASMEIARAFPQAGMIAAQPNFYDVMQGEGRAHLALQENPDFIFSDYRPAAEIVDEYCRGIGAADDLCQEFHTQPLRSIYHQGIQAVLGASHMQFLLPRQAARQVVPLPATRALLRAETMSLDYKLDRLGYLHLSTLQPLVFHMGNTLTESLEREVGQITGAAHFPQEMHPRVIPGRSPSLQLLIRLNRRPFFQQFFLRAYNALFQVLNN